MDNNAHEMADLSRDTFEELLKNPSGEAAGLKFFNIANESINAELHTRDGKLVYLQIWSKEELERRRRGHHPVDHT